MNIVEKGYSFDDVLLVPTKSSLSSRSEVSLDTKVGPFSLQSPIISSPMDTVTELDMLLFMVENGGSGILHRYNSIEEQVAMVTRAGELLQPWQHPIGAAIGVNGDAKERADALIKAGVDYLVIDIAHGHMTQALDMVECIKSDYRGIAVMSGNIVTVEAAQDYVKAGADILRVGVGPGSACSTRLVAGVGYPQLSAISNIAATAPVGIVSDGGVKYSGDVAKALAAGADAVIIGGLLSQFSVAAGEKVKVGDNLVKSFRGMASDDALSARGSSGYLVEGESFVVKVREDHQEWLEQFLDGIRAGLAYLGAGDIPTLQDSARFVEVTPQGYSEGTPHFSLKENA